MAKINSTSPNTGYPIRKLNKIMRKKHIAIEILPRALWLIEGAILFFAYYLTNQEVALTSNIVFLVIGTIITIVGVVFSIQTFRFLAKPMITKELVTDGPYRYARHPMYVAIYITLIGIGLLFFSGLWFIVLIAFIPIWYFDCKLEESQMTDLYGERYLEYKKRAGMFFPHNFI